MYRGFNLVLSFTDEDLFQKGRTLNAQNKLKVKNTLNDFIAPDGSLNGSEIQRNWFSQLDADVFISHSHKDEKVAITLVGWLLENFGIKAFADSCIWGYSNDLLKMIDNKYCLNPNGTSYNYLKRNFSTSHVHIMLTTALNMMIDKTECLFFLNTPNSITASDVVFKTESPWIYSEIAISQMICRKIPQRREIHEKQYFYKGGELNESLKVKYELNLAHLSEITKDNMVIWAVLYKLKKKFYDAGLALDCLYELNPPKDLNVYKKL